MTGHHHTTTTTTTYYYAAPQAQVQYQQSTGYFPGYGPGVQQPQQGYPGYPPQQGYQAGYNQAYSANGPYNPNAAGIYPPTQQGYPQGQQDPNAYQTPVAYPQQQQAGRESNAEAYTPPPAHEGYSGSHSSAYYGLPDGHQSGNQYQNQYQNQYNQEGESSQFSGLGDHASNPYGGGYDNYNQNQYNQEGDSSQFSGLGNHGFDGNYGQQQMPQGGFPYEQQQYNQNPGQQLQQQQQPQTPAPAVQPQQVAPQVAQEPKPIVAAAAPIPPPVVDVEALQEKLAQASLSIPVEEKIDEGLPLPVEDRRGMTQAIVGYINTRMSQDPLYAKSIPVQGDALFKLATDGVLFNKLLNVVAPGSVDERTVNSGSNLNVRQIEENVHLALNSARGLGCDVSRISVSSVLRGNQDKVIELLWAIINKGEINSINVNSIPSLSQLLRPGETMDDLAALSSVQLLLRWVNHQLSLAGVGKRINNFGSDVSDSEAYMYLVNMPSLSLLQNPDLLARAEGVVAQAATILPGQFITPSAIVSGHQALNAFFVSQLFHFHPKMANTSSAPAPLPANTTPEREKRAFLNWMNSLGVEPQVPTIGKNTLSDGLVLLQVLDKVQPGIVNWARVHKQNPSKFQQLEHCNYALELCAQLKVSLVNISGPELQNGSEKLSLAIIWQLMRHHVLHFAGRQSLSEEDIVAWANQKVSSTGRSLTIVDFRDKNLSTSHFIIDLLTACRPGSIDYTKITMGRTPEQKLQNASYAISCARKLGCPTVFLLPEDIVEVNSNLIMTFFASIMQVYGPKNK